MTNKRGQVAIFVIVALIIVVIIALFFVFQKDIVLEKKDEFSPQSYMQECIRESTSSAVNLMLPQGGLIEPANYRLYNSSKVEYLCFNRGNFEPCVNQHPAYFNEMEAEIDNYVYPKISSCYDSLKAELEKRQADVEYGPLSVNSSIAPGKIIMVVNRTASLQQDSSSQRFDSFIVETRSELHKLARVAIEISNQETRYCYFDYGGYMVLYSDVEIDKDVLSDDTKIYSITDRNYGETLMFAIRGCSIPAGI